MSTTLPVRMLVSLCFGGLVACTTQTRHPAIDAFCSIDGSRPTQDITLIPFQTGLPMTGQWRDGFDVADFNGDGHLDLAHGPARKRLPQPLIWLGDGTGRLQVWSDTHFPPLPYDYGDLVVGDVNRDGLPDMALGNHLRGITVLVNESRGHFAPWAEGLVLKTPANDPESKIFASRALAFADWNGDGRLDLIAQNEGQTLFSGDRTERESLRVYLNRDRAWQQLSVAETAPGFGGALVVGDIDGDGHPEAITGTRDLGNKRLLHFGLGATPRSVEVPGLQDRSAVTAVALDPATAGQPGTIWFGSLHGSADSGPCVALSYLDWTAGGATLPKRVAARADRDVWQKILRDDLNGDNRTDLLALAESGRIDLYVAGPNGLRLDSSWPADQYAGCQAFDAVLADFDNQPGLELIVSYAGEDDPLATVSCPGEGGFAAYRILPANPDKQR